MISPRTSGVSKIPIATARTPRSSQPTSPAWLQSTLPVPSRFLKPLFSAPSFSSIRSRHVPSSCPISPSLSSRRAARDARSRPWLVNSAVKVQDPRPTGVTPPVTVGNRAKEALPLAKVKTEKKKVVAVGAVDKLVAGMASLSVAEKGGKEQRLQQLREKYDRCWGAAGRPVAVKPKVRIPAREELIQAKLDKERRVRRSQVVLKPALKPGLDRTPFLDSEEHLAPGMRACYAHRRRRGIRCHLEDKELLADEGKCLAAVEEPLYGDLREMRERAGAIADDRTVGKSLDGFDEPDPSREIRVSFALTPKSFFSVVDRPDIPTALFGTQAHPRTYWKPHWEIPQRENESKPEPTGVFVKDLSEDIQESLAKCGYGFLPSQDDDHCARKQLFLKAFWTDDGNDDLCDLEDLADDLYWADMREARKEWRRAWDDGSCEVPKDVVEWYGEWKRDRGVDEGEAMEVDAAGAGEGADEEDCEMF